MKSVVILTATYNHPVELKKLYITLCKQKNRDFTWVIVNDGSGEETKQILSTICKEGNIDIHIINKENGGKSAAINDGLDCLSSDVEFVVIIDDDEQLFPTAVQTLNEYIDKYKRTECGVIHFNRQNEKGEVIATPEIKEDYYQSYQEFKSKGRHADGYLGYFVKKLGKNRFSIYKNEKYIAPSTLFMKVTDNYKLLWASAVLGKTEYLSGGITKQGRKLRIKNPQGMIEYCEDMQRNGANIKTKILYSIQGYAYMNASKNNTHKPNLIKFCVIPGKILFYFWKKKYM